MLLVLNIFELVQGIAEALGKAGAVYKYDFSLSPKYFYKIVEDLRDRLGENILSVNWAILSIQATRNSSTSLLLCLVLGKNMLVLQVLLQWWSATAT